MDQRQDINIGGVTAYAYARSKGYTGTEAEFAQLMANIGNTQQEIDAAIDEFVNTTAPGAVQAVETAQASALEAIGVSKTDALDAINTSKGSAVAAVNSAGDTQKAAVDAEGQRVIDSIPADYTELTGEVDDLKNAFTANLIHDTATGTIAHLEDGAALPVRDLSVDIEPVQDLNGYDNPWPAGGGKNKLPYPFAETTKTVNGITFTDLGDGTLRVNGTATARAVFFYASRAIRPLPSGDYILSRGTTVGNIGITVDAYNGNTWVKNIKATALSDTPFSIDYDGYDRLDIFAYVASGTTVSNAVVSPMIRLSSVSDSSWSPYSNICPISGWDAVKVTRTGRNLCYKVLNGLVSIGTDAAFFYTLADARSLVFECKAGETYIVSGVNVNRYIWGVFDSEPVNGTQAKAYQSVGNSAVPFTPTADGVCVICVSNAAADTSTAQVELGSTPSTYEPYSGTTYSITFPTSAGTVYGGTLDVTTGKLTVDMKMVDMGSLEFVYNLTVPNFPFFASAILDMASGTDKYLCSNYANSGQHASIAQVPDMACMTIGQQFRVRDSRYDTAAAFKAAVSGVQLCYELATPIVYDLTPTEVSTLLGTNNIFADCGDTTVDYYADPTLYINKKIAAAVAAMS